MTKIRLRVIEVTLYNNEDCWNLVTSPPLTCSMELACDSRESQCGLYHNCELITLVNQFYKLAHFAINYKFKHEFQTSNKYQQAAG